MIRYTIPLGEQKISNVLLILTKSVYSFVRSCLDDNMVDDFE